MRKILSALVIVALGASGAAAQVLYNPGFETNTSTTTDKGNWQSFNSGAPAVSKADITMPHTGSRSQELITGGANQFAGVFQLLTTDGTNALTVSPGDMVTFTGFSKAGPNSPFNGTQEVKLEWQGAAALVDTSQVPGAGQYTMFTTSGVAPAGTTSLVVTYAISTFNPGAGSNDVFIDDFSVNVTHVPEPATVAMVGTGLLGLGAFRRRK